MSCKSNTYDSLEIVASDRDIHFVEEEVGPTGECSMFSTCRLQCSNSGQYLIEIALRLALRYKVAHRHAADEWGRG
jgi:hypothetical protein